MKILVKILAGLTIIFGLSFFKGIIENSSILQSSLMKNASTFSFVFFSCLIVIFANKYFNKIRFIHSYLSFKNFHIYFLKGVLIIVPLTSLSIILILLFNQPIQFNFQGISVLFSIGISALLVSIFEEFVFRGFVSQSIFISTKSLIITSLISSMIFLLIHINNIIQGGSIEFAINLFFAGILLNYLFFYYSSIWVPIGFHFANNLFWNLIDSDMMSIEQKHENQNSELLGWIYTVGIILTAFVYIVRYHKFQLRKLLHRRTI